MTLEAIKRFISASRFQFITLEKTTISHKIAIADGHLLLIDDGRVFEWIAWGIKQEITYSDAGYSLAGAALCDGLIVARQEREGVRLMPILEDECLWGV
jgi:hypothetical protein